MFKRVAWLGSLAILLAFGVVSPPSAEAVCTTDGLLDVGLAGTNTDCLQVGDKIFSNFVLTTDTVGLAVIGDVNLVGVTDPDGNHGFQLRFLGIAAVFGAGELALSYDATVAEGSPDLITDMHLSAVGSVLGSGVGAIIIDEEVDPPVGTTKFLHVQCTLSSCTPDDLSDVAFLDIAVGSIHVDKDITFFCVGREDPCIATVSIVEQTLSQTAVPEPATLLLLGSALAGAGLYSRRKRSREAQS